MRLYVMFSEGDTLKCHIYFTRHSKSLETSRWIPYFSSLNFKTGKGI